VRKIATVKNSVVEKRALKNVRPGQQNDKYSTIDAACR